jgi:hypothetical protein
MRHAFKLKGFYKVRLLNHDGSIAREAIVPNGITNGGKDTVLDIVFNAVATIPNWYVGLIDTVGYTGVDPDDTMSSHSGWNEYQGYSEISRELWNTEPPEDQSIINSTTNFIQFTIPGTAVLKGLFVVSDSTKGGTAGILWSTALFEDSNIGGDWSVDNQTLQIQYGVAIS